MSFLALAVAVPGRAVADQGSYAEILDAEGAPLALVAWDPWQVEVELSVILVEDEPEAAAQAADQRLRESVVPLWEDAGFQAGDVGEVRAGEVDDPEAVVWSYELPITVLAEGPEQIAEILAWIEGQAREFILWDHETLGVAR